MQLYSDSLVNNSVQYCIRYCSFSYNIIPVLNRNLRGYKCRTLTMPVLYNIHQIASASGIKGLYPEVIQYQYPRLDTLLLSLPVSWKRIVAQYAGRLHREYPDKKRVEVYDYIDIHALMCDVMYKRQLKGYASVGYQIQQNDSRDLFGIDPDIILQARTIRNRFLQTYPKLVNQ